MSTEDLRERLVGALMAATPANVGEARVQRVVDDVWPVIEPLVFSGWETGTGGDDMHPETWRERAERMETRARRAEALAEVLSDLDRCEHGRHEGDDCSGCHGPSKGNPVVRAACGRPPLAQYDLRQIGHGLNAKPIVIPERGHTHQPEAWRHG